jgi:ferredoxin
MLLSVKRQRCLVKVLLGNEGHRTSLTEPSVCRYRAREVTCIVRVTVGRSVPRPDESYASFDAKQGKPAGTAVPTSPHRRGASK